MKKRIDFPKLFIRRWYKFLILAIYEAIIFTWVAVSNSEIFYNKMVSHTIVVGGIDLNLYVIWFLGFFSCLIQMLVYLVFLGWKYLFKWILKDMNNDEFQR